MATRLKPGDIGELPTKDGSLYLQCVRVVPQWGPLVRVFAGFHSSPPSDWSTFAERPEQFQTFFPLAQAIRAGIARIAANAPLPPTANAFPVFRAAGFIDRAGKVHDWWLWDGTKEWQVGSLSADQRCLPIREVVNDTLLIQRVADAWTPATDRHSQ